MHFALQPLMGELVKTWPNIIAGESPFDFWSREWEKHGTCAQSVPAFAGELNFFNQTIQLNAQVNVFGCVFWWVEKSRNCSFC